MFLEFYLDSSNFTFKHDKYANVPPLVTTVSVSSTITNTNQIIVVKIDPTIPQAYIQLINRNNYSSNSVRLPDFLIYTTTGNYYYRIGIYDWINNMKVDTNCSMNYNEILVYGDALIDSQITQIVQKLNQKWQIY